MVKWKGKEYYLLKILVNMTESLKMKNILVRVLSITKKVTDTKENLRIPS